MPQRTAMGNPLSGVSVKRTPVAMDNTLSVLSNMTQIGAGVLKMSADAQEDQSVMDAQNDIVNKNVNPDKNLHDAAYAWTIAEGEAWDSWNKTKAEILNNEHSETAPEDFQKQVKEGHTEYYKKWEGNNNASGAIGAYNKIMVTNQPALIAAQAGAWRKDQGVKQGSLLTNTIHKMAGTGKSTDEDYINEIESPKYSLLDPQKRIQSALVGAATQAEETGDTSLLKGLNDQFGFDVDPALKGTYNAALKAADRKRYANETEQRYKTVAVVDDAVERGVLLDGHYNMFKDEKNIKGNPLYTPKQFKALVRASDVNRSKIKAIHNNAIGYTTGIDLTELKNSDFNGIADKQYKDDLDKHDDPLIAMEYTGKYLARQSQDWDTLKQRAGMFSREPMMVDNTPSKEAMDQYYELSALERGMNATTDGSKVFTRYLGDSLVKYEMIKKTLESTKDTKENAWTTVATSMELRKKELRRKSTLAGLSTKAKNAGEVIAQEMYSDNKNMFMPDFIENSFNNDNPSGRMVVLAAKEFERAKAEGAPDEVAYGVAKKVADRQFSKFNGTLYDTHGIDIKTLVGCEDPDEALSMAMDDPEHNKILGDMFGVTLKEMYFGKDDPGSDEEDIREYKEDREGKKVYTSKTDLVMDINMSTGMLDFTSRDVEGNPMTYSISMEDIGTMYKAKVAGVVDINQLDRLYGEKYLSTDSGREYFNLQEAANDQFVIEVLETSVGSPIFGAAPTMSSDEYVHLPEQERTRVRIQYYKHKYKGVMGRVKQFADFAKSKYEADTWHTPWAATKPYTATLPQQAAMSQSVDDRHIYKGSKDMETFKDNEITPDTIKALIPKAEGTDRFKHYGYASEYDVTLAYGKYDPIGDKVVTDMTIREAMAFSNSIRRHKDNDHNAGPIGKYQFLGSTIKAIYKQAGLTTSDKMTPANQEKMYRVALDHAGYSGWKNGTRTKASFLKRLKGYWEGFGKNPKEIDKLFKS